MSGPHDISTHTDEQLAVLVQGGKSASAAAYALLYKRHAPAVLAFLASRLRDRHEASDLCQHVWLKVWEQLGTHFQADHFRGWVFQMTRNLLIDHVRRRRPVEMPEEFDPSDSRDNESHDGIDTRVDQLRPCVDALSQDRRDIVQRRLAGHSFDDISAQLGIPPNTAMTRFHRAKDQLRECIEQRTRGT